MPSCLGAWVFAGSIWEVLFRAKFLSVPLAETARRVLSMRRAQFAATLGHIGLAVAVIGVAGGSAWVSERLTVMKPGESADLAGYTITFKEVFERQGPNYAELAGAFELRRSGGGLISTIIASKRRYDAPPQATKQAGISVRPGGDVYVVLGDEAEGGGFADQDVLPPLRALDMGRLGDHVHRGASLASRPALAHRPAAGRAQAVLGPSASGVTP